MLSKIKSLTLADWIFIVVFDLVVFFVGYKYGSYRGRYYRGSVPIT